MGGTLGGPGVFVGAEEPDCVGSESGGLGRSGNLDGRIVGFGREESFVESAGEGGEEFRPTDATAIEAKRAACVDRLLPAIEGLELRA